MIRRLLALALVASACQRHPAPSIPPASHQLDDLRQPRRLVAALDLQPGQRVAEIGAGSGYLTPYLAAAVGPAGRVVATDKDAEVLAVLRQRTQGLPQVEARRVSADEPGLEAGRYDLIFLAQVDHLLPPGYLTRLLPALRPGGRLAISNNEPRRPGALRLAQALPLTLREPVLGINGTFLLVLSQR